MGFTREMTTVWYCRLSFDISANPEGYRTVQ